MKHLFIIVIISVSLITLSCDETSNIFDGGSGGGTDPLIDQDIAEAQDYNLTTPVYGMQVAVRNDVGKSDNAILELLDNRASGFLGCQFEAGSDLGFQDVMLANGDTIGPLSELRVFVVPRNFKCEAVDLDVCAGIYFFGNDIIVISVGGFSGCGEFALWRHELGHRYGMKADHSNQGEFKACADEEGCEFNDVIGFGGIGVGG